ncbi:MAG: Txe/YoeB family addiction module toxin [bacterium]
MRLTFTDAGWEDYLWLQQYQPQLLKRVNDLIKDANRTPFKGIGKPEPLKRDLRGCWSRRVTDEHRLVYKVEHDTLVIISYRYHYE